ncbi:ornithine--oxo-acid transaminase [Propionicicella superfundia]|uniref:ornithine--oxo-acid transaminase n=1 Tax=Propionicicella superfundia TaxID=348582 RepID=UPI000406BE7E|nr:ornithine--oxo-acid transaminase [Propionicicella superfundia]
MARSHTVIDQIETFAAHNYHPLPVVIESAQGVWMTDVDGRRYMDFLSAYSAMNFGHNHPVLVEAAVAQLHKVCLTSRAFYASAFGPFAQDLCELLGMDMMLPMNTGAEAVETAIKLARKWGYQVKGVAPDAAEIVGMQDNFHGRTTTIISLSNDDSARADFGPYTPGLTSVPFGDVDALRAAITPNTVAVLLEPIQGEAGVILPPEGFLAEVRRLTRERNVLMIVDEIQTGMARTGTTLYCDQVGVEPDLVLLGKALGGGIVPVSAVVGTRDVLGLIQPGQHGSTFGGNPLASAVGSAVIALLHTGEMQQRAVERGAQLRAALEPLVGHGVTEVRTAGLWAGVDIDPAAGTGREVSERLLERGLLVKDTHVQTIRIAPPLVITEGELEWAMVQLAEVVESLRS